MPDDKLNIYPPSIIDPLLPGGIQSPPDGSEKHTGVDPGGRDFSAEVASYHANLGPVAPDPEGAARDAYLGELARENLAGKEDVDYGFLLREVLASISDAETLQQVERLSGNIVKEEFFKGQLSSLRLMESWIRRLMEKRS